MVFGEFIKKITTKEEFLSWAGWINRGMTIKLKVEFQDIYARSNQKDIEKFFLESSVDERRLLLCSIMNTMNYDEVEKLLRCLASHKAQEIIDKERKIDTEEFVTKMNLLEESKRHYEETTEHYRNTLHSWEVTRERLNLQIEVLVEEKINLKNCLEEKKVKYAQYKDDAIKFRVIKDALK